MEQTRKTYRILAFEACKGKKIFPDSSEEGRIMFELLKGILGHFAYCRFPSEARNFLSRQRVTIWL
jgi:hypothetical protein